MSKPIKWDQMTEFERKKWREKRAEHQRKYRENNSGKPPEYYRKYRENNKEKRSESDRKYRENNRDKILEYYRKYRENNKQQSAADQFFIMAGAAEQISQTLTEIQNETNTKPKRNIRKS
jgi:hypothetical protein